MLLVQARPPDALTGTLIQGRDLDRHTPSASQGERPGTHPFPRTLKRNQPCRHLDLVLAASRTVKSSVLLQPLSQGKTKSAPERASERASGVSAPVLCYRRQEGEGEAEQGGRHPLTARLCLQAH